MFEVGQVVKLKPSILKGLGRDHPAHELFEPGRDNQEGESPCGDVEDIGNDGRRRVVFDGKGSLKCKTDWLINAVRPKK